MCLRFFDFPSLSVSQSLYVCVLSSHSQRVGSGGNEKEPLLAGGGGEVVLSVDEVREREFRRKSVQQRVRIVETQECACAVFASVCMCVLRVLQSTSSAGSLLSSALSSSSRSSFWEQAKNVFWRRFTQSKRDKRGILLQVCILSTPPPPLLEVGT